MDLSAAPAGKTRTRQWLGAAFITAISAIALTLRLHMIGARSFCVDEGISVAIGRLRWSDYFGILWRREGNMSLYYILLRGWLYLGNSDAMIRALSAIASTGAVIAIYFLGKRMIDRTTGAIAAFLTRTKCIPHPLRAGSSQLRVTLALDWVKFPTGREFYDFLLLFTGQAGIVMLCISFAFIAAVTALLILESRTQNNSAKTFPFGMIVL
jgi:predicted membrane-bound mannosyltransferase